MEEMITKCKELEIDSMSDEELMEAMNRLKQEALSRNNPYIEALIAD